MYGELYMYPLHKHTQIILGSKTNALFAFYSINKTKKIAFIIFDNNFG